jgi:hypothetical protein
MNSGIRFYVFSLSKKDDAFKDGKIETAVNWLRKKENPYYFREKKPKNGLPSGSIVLFSCQGQIFGQATVKNDVRKLSLEEQREHGPEYKHCMVLKRSSIEIFPKPYPKKKDVAPKIRKNFGRLFTILDSEQYHMILEMAKV